ncbi:MAG: hypothetical protein H6659_01280 [Ardenticatenaceae bacterium]|nr:hypothetical protein [Ardenticatenaceae bacterium]MCB8986238.1 hypothetical protein [Ardenticatenaceae bacterium]
MNRADFQLLELNGGLVTFGTTTTCWLPPVSAGYADAQFDDYAGDGSGLWGWGHGRFRWHPGLTLSLRARFSHEADRLVGTAGFGFWNSPFGDPSVPRPALPQATWFFFASEPSNLPLPLEGPGRGWFAATVDAGQRTAVSLIPLAPFVLLLNRLPAARRRIWPIVRRRLGISFAPIPAAITAWHTYTLTWLPDGCVFKVDGRTILQTSHSPRGPLGFVCWMDNQYMAVTVDGRFGWGALSVPAVQWLEVADLAIYQA